MWRGGEILLLFKKDLSGLANNLRTLSERPCGPSVKCLIRCRQRKPHPLVSMLGKSLECFSGRWIDAAVWHAWLLAYFEPVPQTACNHECASIVPSL